MRCPPISQHHRRGRRVGAEASRLINETGHAPRIGAGNGALGQTTARGSGARPAHWGRQRCIGAGKLPTPMPVFLPQCGSPYSGAHCSRGLEPRSAAKKAPSAPRSGQRGIISGADRLRPTHAPLALRFHSDTAIRVGGSAGLSRTAALFSQQYHAFTAVPHFASVITLAK